MTDTVLTDTDIARIMDRATDAQGPQIFPVRLVRATEQAVLQSPEIVAMRKDAERYRWATANDGNAETLNSIVICHNGDQAKVNERVDAYRSACAAAEIGRRMES